MPSHDKKPSARLRLLDAAFAVIRQQGYSATTVDDLCNQAGVTKGSFFHHFKTKEALAVAAADHWSETTGGLFARAPYHQPADPLDRVLAYLDFRKDMVQGDIAEFTCLVGTMVQEVYERHDEIRQACERSIRGHAKTLEQDIAQAMAEHRIDADWTAASLALHTQTVLQGAFVLAKATGDAGVVLDSIDHLRRYIEQLFDHPPAGRKRSGRRTSHKE